jgi:hypothetical protein
MDQTLVKKFLGIRIKTRVTKEKWTSQARLQVTCNLQYGRRDLMAVKTVGQTSLTCQTSYKSQQLPADILE